MKVLLLAPVATLDPHGGGDVTYTQTLVANPPPGVSYETYDHAQQRGALRERGVGRALKALMRASRLRAMALMREAALTGVSKGVQAMRARRWLYWEPFRFFEVKPGEYDLIHVHVFSVRLDRLDCPLVVSCGGPLSYLYADARGYSNRAIARLDRIDTAIARAMGVNVPDKFLPQAQRAMVYSPVARQELADRGVLPAERLDVVPIFQPTPVLPPLPARPPFRVGFVARNFEHKGGPTLLRAWPFVLAARPDARLVIAGSPRPAVLPPAEQEIEWRPYIARQELLDELIPSLDVFAYPTNYDYLPCYTLLEAMARGVPIAGSDYRDMKAVLGDRAGLVSPCGDARALADNILRLLEPDANREFRVGARARFESSFSRHAVTPLLSACYQKAVSRKIQ